MVHTGVAASAPRSSRLAGAVSVVLHGAAVWLLIALGGPRGVPAPRTVAVTAVEVVTVAPPPPPPSLRPARTAPVGRPPGSRVGAAVHGRREPVQRAQPTAPPAVQSLASLEVHHDGPASFADHAAARPAEVTSGAGASGIGTALGVPLADGFTSVSIPDAPGAASRARSPRPRHDYRNLRITGASKFAGRVIKLQLSIDERGQVRAVQLLQGVDRELDRRTVALVRGFEYEPGLDEDGTPVPGTSRWNFEIVEDDGAL